MNIRKNDLRPCGQSEILSTSRGRRPGDAVYIESLAENCRNGCESMIDLKKYACVALGAAMFSLPVSAGAVTLKITDMGSGATEIVRNSGTAGFSGTVGGFTLDAASAGIFRSADQYMLTGTSVLANGKGRLKITVRQGGLTDLSAVAALQGDVTVSDAVWRVVVRNFIDTGAGWTLLGDAMEFYRRDGDGQSDSISDTAATTNGSFRLRTVIQMISGKRDQSGSVATSLTAFDGAEVRDEVQTDIPVPVPVPAAGLLMLGALGGLGVAARRRRAKA